MDSPYRLTWQQDFRIRGYEVGPLGRISVQTLFNYMIEAATNHAMHLGVSVTDLFAQGQTWVLSRLHLRVECFPAWPGAVRVDTWPSGRQGLFATREFRLSACEERDAGAGTGTKSTTKSCLEDGTEISTSADIGIATSSWMIIDQKSRRPIRVPVYFDKFSDLERGRVIASNFPRLTDVERCDVERFFQVRRSDLDINRHVNAVRYLDWALEIVPPAIWQECELRELEIAYRAESLYGDRVHACCQVEQEKSGHCVIHKLLHEESGKELTRLVTWWQARSSSRSADAPRH